MSRKNVYMLFKPKAIKNKRVKFNHILIQYGYNLQPNDFAKYFIKEFPEDWESIKRKYNIHILCHNGATEDFPMLNPYAHLKMLYMEHLKSLERIHNKIESGIELSNTEKKMLTGCR